VRVARRRGSAATVAGGAENLPCAYLAAAGLAGLALHAAFGLWWADAAAALVAAAATLREAAQARGNEHGDVDPSIPGGP